MPPEMIEDAVVDENGNAEAPSRDQASVTEWTKKVEDAKIYHAPAFKRMRQDSDFLAGKQWYGQTRLDDDRYIANITHKLIKTRTAALYAKNPTVVARRYPRLDFEVWDEKPETFQAAIQNVVAAIEAGQPAQPADMQLIADVRRGMMFREQMAKISKTLETLYRYYQKEQHPNYKKQMKKLVRRACTTGVGYVKSGYQRLGEVRPDTESKLADMAQRVAHIDRLMEADEKPDNADQLEADKKDLEVSIKTLQSEEMVIVREGLVWEFPRSTRIIPDPDCVDLDGWLGAGWIAEEFEMSVAQIKETYGTDVSGEYKAVSASSPSSRKPRTSGWGRSSTAQVSGSSEDKCFVWEIYDKASGALYVICDGHSKFLQEPKAPDVKVEGFFPIRALTFNEIEHDDQLFPISDVRLVEHQQREYNRNREAKRQHRIANRPLYGLLGGALDEDEEDTMAAHAAHDIIKINSIGDGRKVQDVLAPIPKAPLDPNLYDTGEVFADVQRVMGASEANFGGTAGASATENSISETTRLSDLSSSSDDLDGLLSDLARDGSQILLLNADREIVLQVVGPGAVWPELSAEDIVEEIYLDVEAGSSGRPNQAQEIANFERLAPYLLQTEGIVPRWLARKMVQMFDDKVDLTEALAEGLPSMSALNRLVGNALPGAPGAAGGAGGGVSSLPEDQGAQGAENAPALVTAPGGSQPDFGAAQSRTPDGLS